MKKRFVVDLGTVEMSDKTVRQVEATIQRAALGALAEVDFNGDLIARFPHEWLGLWIDIGRDLRIDDKAFQEFAGR